MLQAGSQIRDYEVWGRMGGGGMSDVWLARHTVLAQPVIIKTLKPEIDSEPGERLRRIVNEARLTARVSSPHVVRSIDAGLHQDTPYLVQEYVDGIDMNELDTSRRRALGLGLPLWFVCEAVAQIAEGLHAAHHNGVLHRDIKPSNLFGSPQEGLKLGDFGIAMARTTAQQSRGDSCGTLRFMSAEALRGEVIDRRADVFGLGATACDLRYGHPPFSEVEQVLNGAPPTFPAPHGAQEAYFQHVLRRMLAARREDRYRDLTEPCRLLHALANSLNRHERAAVSPDGSLLFGTTRIVCETGDIALAAVDAIVSSANPMLSMRTGVGEALRQRGGDQIELEAMSAGPRPLGSCVVTGSGTLGCQRVLHAVSAWEEASCIGRATQRALLQAEELNLSTLALPALGTGAARVTIEASAFAQISALKWHLALGGSRIREVRFVLYDERKLDAFREVVESVMLEAAADGAIDLGLSDHSRGPVSVGAPTMLDGSRITGREDTLFMKRG